MRGRRAILIGVLGLVAALGAVAAFLSADAHAVPWQQPEQIVVSPDGRHVYVSSGQGLLALARDQQTGALDLVGSYPLARSTSNVQGAEPLAISSDGLSVYAARDPVPPTFPFEPPIRAFARDPVTGLLHPRAVEGPLSAMPATSFLVGRTHMLARVPTLNGDRLRAYERLPSGGLRSAGGDIDRVAGLRVTPLNTGLSAIDDQQRLYLELDNYEGRAMSEPYQSYVGVFPFAGGSVGAGQVYACPSRCPTEMSSDGVRMYGFDAAERDPVSGGLTFLDGYQRTLDSNVFNQADTATWGRSLYAVDGYRHQLWHQVDTGSGWSAPDVYRDGRDGAQGIRGGRALAVSPDGRHLYVGAGRYGGIAPGIRPPGYGERGTVATYERATDGSLRYRSLFTGPDNQDVTVQVNGGSGFARSTVVRVAVGSRVSDPGDVVRQAVVARTAGLAGGAQIGLADGAGSVRWRLTEGVNRVFVLAGRGVRASAKVTLDRRRPSVVRVRRARAHAKRLRRSRDQLRIRVKDRGTGVRAVQITRQRGKPGRWRSYKARRAYVVGRGRVYVRVRDKAGNASRWKAVRRR